MEENCAFVSPYALFVFSAIEILVISHFGMRAGFGFD